MVDRHRNERADILGGSWRGKRRDVIKASGYVAHSLEAALWCVGRTGSFAEAVKTVRENLSKGVSKTTKVYEVVMPDRKLAVFGVAMNELGTTKPDRSPAETQTRMRSPTK